MGNKYKEVGGGPATGLADSFVKFLQQGITTGSFGGVTAGQHAGAADPFGSTAGIGGILNDLLAGGAGNIGGSMADMISKQSERDVANLRARFGTGGGVGAGTPAAYGEALLRSETAPKLATAVGGLQLQTLSQLLPIFAGLAGKGISQRETIATPNPLVSTIGSIAPLISAASTFFGNPFGPAGAAAGGFNLAPAPGGGPGNNFGIPMTLPFSFGQPLPLQTRLFQ